MSFNEYHLQSGGKIYLGVIKDFLKELDKVNNDDDSLLMNDNVCYYEALTSPVYLEQLKEFNCQHLKFVNFYPNGLKSVYFGRKFECQKGYLVPLE